MEPQEKQVNPVKYKIYQPTKSAMSSGKGKTKQWIAEPFAEQDASFIDPIIGWTSSTDTSQQLKLSFATRKEAIAFAERCGHDYQVIEPRQPKLVKKTYADNFR